MTESKTIGLEDICPQKAKFTVEFAGKGLDLEIRPHSLGDTAHLLREYGKERLTEILSSPAEYPEEICGIVYLQLTAESKLLLDKHVKVMDVRLEDVPISSLPLSKRLGALLRGGKRGGVSQCHVEYELDLSGKDKLLYAVTDGKILSGLMQAFFSSRGLTAELIDKLAAKFSSGKKKVSPATALEAQTGERCTSASPQSTDTPLANSYH